MMWPPTYSLVIRQPVACLAWHPKRNNRELRRAYRYGHTKVLRRAGK